MVQARNRGSADAAASTTSASSASGEKPTPASSQSKPSAGARRRKPGKKPAGSKWLNRLLGLGCCASLLPLGFEWYWSRHPEHLVKPHRDDPWVRVIDAAPPEKVLSSSSVSKRWRHHPRHGKRQTQVRADGTAAEEEEEEESVFNASDDSALDVGASEAAAASVMSKAKPPMSVHLARSSPASSPIKPDAITTAAAALNATVQGIAPSGRPASLQREDDGDDIRHFLRSVDRATEPNRSTNASSFGGRPRATAGFGAHRMWRMVPGGVHDIVEGEGDNQTVFSVEGMHPPETRNGSYVVDQAAALDRQTLLYLNRNLSWVDKLTPFRVLLLVLPRQPNEPNARRIYATQMLRAWYGNNRMLERTSLVVISLDGYVEIAVGKQLRMVFSEPVARHFAGKAMELLHTLPSTDATARVQETAQKLIFYVAFTVRSRTQATALSMRSMSMFMMLFMMITISVTKQQQARRYAELYGVDPYGRHAPLVPFGFLSQRGMYEQEMFWDDFERGRHGEGGAHGHSWQQRQIEQREDAFFRLQLLHMLLSRRQEVEEDGEEDEEGEEVYLEGEEGEEHELLAAQADFYEEERRCANRATSSSRY